MAPPRVEKTDFGVFRVYPDAQLKPFAGKGSNQVSESEFREMNQAWTNIHSGIGMDIKATGADQVADKNAWDNMLANGMSQSSTFRKLICEIGNDHDKADTISINLGRDQQFAGSGVMVDSFVSNDVDLSDLEFFPLSPSRNAPDDETQPEAIVHLLAERRYDRLNPTSEEIGPITAAQEIQQFVTCHAAA
jgi:hypothetical protein